jgi:PleD family two-component response regulator
LSDDLFGAQRFDRRSADAGPSAELFRIAHRTHPTLHFGRVSQLTFPESSLGMMKAGISRILVVDDDGDVRDVLVEIPQNDNYRVSSVANGALMRDF